jgi:hypothetical protein
MVRWMTLLLASLWLGGCAHTARGMVASPHVSTLAPPPGHAGIIFVRHSRLGGSVSFPIVSEDGQFVANLRGSMNATLALAEGHHRFFVLAENAELVELDVVAGRTYVVEARPRMGWGKARVTAETVRRGTPRFAAAPSWIRATQTYVPEPVAGAAWANANRASVLEKIARATADFNSSDGEYRAVRTLQANDGYQQGELWQ